MTTWFGETGMNLCGSLPDHENLFDETPPQGLFEAGGQGILSTILREAIPRGAAVIIIHRGV
jgi:hypothetical protein